MKRRFSKLISMMLVTIMVLSLVQLPAFAAVPVYRDPAANQNKPGTSTRQHRSWIAPYGDEVAHFDYYAEDGTNEVQYLLYMDTETMHMDPDGILVMTSGFGTSGESQNNRVIATTDNGATGAQSGNIGLYSNSPYIFNFDDPFCYSSGNGSVHAGATDSTTAVIIDAKVETDAQTGNKYLVSDYSYSGGNFISIPQRWLRPTGYPDDGAMNSFIIAADVLLKADEDFAFGIRYGTAHRKNDYIKWNHTTKKVTDADGRTIANVEPGWHKLKLMLVGNVKTADNPNPYRSTTQMYTLFFDDELLTPTRENIYNSQTYLAGSRTNNLFQFQGAGGVDNFKLYGSSTPHPYNVRLDKAPMSGDIVSGSAAMACVVDYTNEETHFEYSYYVSDTEDINGTYTKVTSTDVTEPLYLTRRGMLALNGDFTGRHIKVGARVSNRGGLSPEIMSKEIYTVSGYADDSGLGPEPDEGDDPSETPGELPPYIVYLAENHPNDARVGQYHGKTALKWGPGETELKKGMSTEFREAQDKYGFLVIEMYSAKKTYHPLNAVFYKEGGSYYVQSFCANWEGEWRTVKLPISGGFGDNGGCGGRKSPTWRPYETNHITLSASLHDSSRFYEDTELYISKMYFEGSAEGKTLANENGEVILPDYYDPSTMTDYAAMVKERYPNKAHPRLIMTDEKIAALKNSIENDEFLGRVYAEFKKKADALVGHEPEPPYEVTNGKVTMERNYFERVAKYCGLMYLLTGEDKYAEQVWVEAANMIGSDVLWSAESTGLDAAHITNGMALLYDWCYDYLNDAQKLAIRNALMRHGYNYAIKIRNGGGYMGYRNNVVAANSKGFVTSALAICDEPGYENFCNELISLVAKYLPENIGHQYVPDGNYAEGIGYWSYATYSMMFMTDAMLSATGTDAGIQDMPGLDVTGYFPLAMRGASLVFNFSDANRNVHQNMSPVYYYLANRYDIPVLRAYRTSLVEQYLTSTEVTSVPALEDLIWYDTSKPYDADWRSKMPKDYFLDGLVPILSMRSGGDNDELYIGAKGGNGRIGHIQYDGGTFVLDAGYTDSNGVKRSKRWVHDMGADTYNRTRDNKYYYRVRTEGHNCIVFNPEGEEVGQTIAKNEYDTYCPIVDSGASENEAFGVINLQPSYQEYVNEYKRGYALVNNRSQFIIQDKFSRKEAGELYSYLHIAESDMVVASDSHSITLKQKSQWNYLKIDFITDIPDFEIGITDAIHHLESLRPDPTQDSNYNGFDCSASYNKVYFHADNVKDATITMVLTPFRDGESIVAPDIKPMENWDEYLGDTSYANYSEVVVNRIDGNKVNITSSWILSNKKKTIILAAYKNDVLTEVKSVSATIFRIDDYTVPGFDPKDYDTIKAFIWDDMTKTLTPVGNVKEIKK